MRIVWRAGVPWMQFDVMLSFMSEIVQTSFSTKILLFCKFTSNTFLLVLTLMKRLNATKNILRLQTTYVIITYDALTVSKLSIKKKLLRAPDCSKYCLPETAIRFPV